MFQLIHKISYLYSRFRNRIYKVLQENRFSFLFELGVALSAAVGVLFIVVFFGMKMDLFSVRGSIDQRNDFFRQSTDSKNKYGEVSRLFRYELNNSIKDIRKKVFPDTTFAWANSEEWKTVADALYKDREVIRRAAYDAGVSPRVLVSVVIAEQLRFFTSDRESFKKFFEPLKILGTLSQFSLGVSGVKQETALQIESNLKNPNSDFYIGKQFEHLLDAHTEESGSSVDEIRFQRLTDSKDHYYSYLYTAVFIKQIDAQWKKAGFPITDRPEIFATLFNLGFDKSIPKASPQVAGAEILVGGEMYTFGRLAYEFYYGGELIDVFGF